MKTAYYQLSDREGRTFHQIVIFDETAKCIGCGLPVMEASTSGTALCGACDCGHLRPGGVRQRYATKINPNAQQRPSAWYNVTEEFTYPTREEADSKMYELHKSGIPGWFHIVERMRLKDSSAPAGEVAK